MPAQRLAVALLAAAGLSEPMHASRASGSPITHIVVIEGMKYQPDLLTVKRGEWVQWINKDLFTHTVTAPGAFDSHNIAVGGTWKYLAGKVGDYHYACTLHPNMKGTLQVE
jgi:plastocyanin